MSETRSILEDSAHRLFSTFEEPALLRRVEAGEWPAEIWTGISALGLDQIFSGASDDPWRDACVVLKACGRHALPAPLAETLAASALLAAAGIAAPEGPLTLAGEGLTLSGQAVGGTAPRVAWGRAAKYVVAEIDEQLALTPIGAATISHNRGIGREPRDGLRFDSATSAVGDIAAGYARQVGALARAAQMAGAIEAVLAMTVQYAKERSQFGKPIGSFQAIQHQLAILAGHSAAATRAVDAAFERIAEGGDTAFEAAVAKIRTGEAAGAAASIAHQTHGAIGFTDEHRLHYFTRRLWSWRTEFGSEAYWSAWLGRRVAATGQEAFWPMVTAAG